MALPYTFGNLTSWQADWLDDDFAALGACSVIPCTMTGTNALVLTPLADTPVPAAYADHQIWGGIAVGDNSGATTANAATLGVKNVYKDTASGPAALAGGEIKTGNYILLAYDAALNTGTGGFHLITAPSTAAGTITNVTAGTGIAGGGASGAVTVSLASVADLRVLANVSGGSAAPSANTLTAILDAIMSSTQGAVLYRGAALWSALGIGTVGQYLYAGGAATNPSWKGGVATGISAAGSTQGDATQLAAEYNQIGTVGSGAGVKLATTVGMPQWVWNDGANSLLVYPPSGAQINSLGTNNPATISTGAGAGYVMLSATLAKSFP
jgi:hypothetical protein